MELSLQLFLLFAFLPLLAFASRADPIYLNCAQNFTGNNILQGNIHEVIDTMKAKAPSTGSVITRAGAPNNTVYGLARCRGDVGRRACSDCISAAAKELHTSCPDAATVHVWYEACSLRYDTVDFIGSVDTSDLRGWLNVVEAEDSSAFNAAVRRLLSWVEARAAASSSKFGMGKGRFANLNVTVYGMEYCTPDLRGSTCSECLETIWSDMQQSCSGKVGCYLMSSSCALRYELYDFLLARTIPVYEDDGNGALAGSAPSPTAF